MTQLAHKIEIPDQFRKMAEQGELGKLSSQVAIHDSTRRGELSRIALLILTSDSKSWAPSEAEEAAARLKGRERLAASLGCRAEDLQEVADSYGEQQWAEMVFEERVKLGIDHVSIRDANWDSLEGAALRKLFLLVESNSVSQPMELLAIAKAANSANRGKRAGAPSHQAGNGNMTQINMGFGFQPGDPENGILPAGNLGTIQLSLSSRVQSQIAAPMQRVADGERVIDSVEMLDLKAIQAAGEESEQE